MSLDNVIRDLERDKHSNGGPLALLLTQQSQSNVFAKYWSPVALLIGCFLANAEFDKLSVVDIIPPPPGTVTQHHAAIKHRGMTACEQVQPGDESMLFL